jgi:hypothetical protein
MEQPSVHFCPNCGSIKYGTKSNDKPKCCPDFAPEFVTAETASFARVGFLLSTGQIGKDRKGSKNV